MEVLKIAPPPSPGTLLSHFSWRRFFAPKIANPDSLPSQVSGVLLRCASCKTPSHTATHKQFLFYALLFARPSAFRMISLCKHKTRATGEAPDKLLCGGGGGNIFSCRRAQGTFYYHYLRQ